MSRVRPQVTELSAKFGRVAYNLLHPDKALEQLRTREDAPENLKVMNLLNLRGYSQAWSKSLLALRWARLGTGYGPVGPDAARHAPFRLLCEPRGLHASHNLSRQPPHQHGESLQAVHGFRSGGSEYAGRVCAL